MTPSDEPAETPSTTSLAGAPTQAQGSAGTSSALSGAQRLQAYRSKLKTQELVRAEIVMPKTVREQVQSVADAEGTRYLDTLSALAQLGLETYQAQAASSRVPASPPVRAFRSLAVVQSFCAVNFTAAANASTSSVPGESPIARFLRSRKEAPSD